MDSVVVVGAGVIGLCTAVRLREHGCEVTVVDRGRAGRGATWANAGWVVPSLSAPLAAPGAVGQAVRAVVRRGGPLRLSPARARALAPWLWQFRAACSAARHDVGRRAMTELSRHAVRSFDQLAADGVAFSFTRSGLLSAFLDEDSAEHSRRALADVGYPPPTLQTGAQLREHEPLLAREVRAGYQVGSEAAVDPQSLVRGLLDRLGDLGVPVLEDWPVEALEWGADRVHGVRGTTDRLPADHVVLAAGAWTTGLLPRGRRFPLQAARGYSMTVALPSRPRSSLYFPEAKVGVVPVAGGARLAGALDLTGLDESAPARRLRAVRREADRYLSGVVPGWTEGWSGLRSVTPDGLPVLGRLPGWRNVTVGCGHAMLGVTLGPLSGTALAELALGLPSTHDVSAFRLERFGARTSAAARRPASTLEEAR